MWTCVYINDIYDVNIIINKRESEILTESKKEGNGGGDESLNWNWRAKEANYMKIVVIMDVLNKTIFGDWEPKRLVVCVMSSFNHPDGQI